MKIIIKSRDIDNSYINFKELDSLVSLLDLHSHLYIVPESIDDDFIISAIESKIFQYEIEIIQAVLDKKDLVNFIDIFDDTFEYSLKEYFNFKDLQVIFDDSFWKLIIKRCKQFQDSVANGCGNHLIDAPELSFNGACNIHDVMYQVTDLASEKEMADLKFYENMIEDSREKYKVLFPLYKVAALIYYKSVVLFGNSSTNIKK